MAKKPLYMKHGGPVERLLRPYQEFFFTASFGGLLLLGSTILALVWANSPWAESYEHLWHTEISLHIGSLQLSETLHHWINDGLMAVFFFTVGLEIKRELLTGELSTPRQAMLPIAAAVGGMIVPAAIYAWFNAGTPEVSGWGVPMATDIAFALGILALVGDRVPVPLKIFLTALAIVDDLGAVLVIAFFYTSNLDFTALGLGAALLVAMIAANIFGVRAPSVYLGLGFATWLCFLYSGVHATIAGVLAAMTIPAKTMIDEDEFEARAKDLMKRFRAAQTDSDRKVIVQALEYSCLHVEAPLQRIEHSNHFWVAFVIMPVFALSNAGLELGAGLLDAFSSAVTLGIVFGLVVGKQIGVTLFSYLVVKLGWASLPEGVSWQHVYAASWLAGIGFTMSLFIANLGFESADVLSSAKAGVLAASLIAGVVGYLLMKRVIASHPTA